MADEHVDPINQKTCILRASIHCQGCKRKVKKILSQLHGVEYVDVDSKQQKVTVIGNVDADTLIRKLAKSGKKAELWPQIYQTNSGMKKEKEKEKKIESHAEAPSSSDNGRTLESPTEVEAATKDSQGSAAPVKANGGGGGGGGDARALTGPSVKANGDVQEKKMEEESKSQESSSVAPGIKEKEAVERSNGGGGNGGDSGTSVKKMKKKGQSSDPAAPSAHRGLENREPGPPPGTNESPPRNHCFPPPPALQPVYAVSYNTAHPSSSYTSSYYSAPPPHAYAYMHGMEPPPLDQEMNPRQPLDSFEIFSDENPNGCFIM